MAFAKTLKDVDKDLDTDLYIKIMYGCFFMAGYVYAWVLLMSGYLVCLDMFYVCEFMSCKYCISCI